MFSTPPGKTKPVASKALWLQGALVLLALLMAIGPGSAGTALYIPLSATSHAQGIAWTRHHGGTLLGPGPLPGSLIIHSDASGLTLAAAAQGALLIAVPATLCGEASPSGNQG